MSTTRSEAEMMDIILNTARQQGVLAVYMNGSRANPNAPKDPFQDYDIVYVVKEIAPYLEQPNWLDAFGEILIMQEPEKGTLFDEEHDITSRYAYLMQFTDGTRIDLSLVTLERAKREIAAESQTILLMDEQGILPKVDPCSDKSYWVKRPTKEQFLECCNEFWWVSLYVAKGLWRGELLYAMEMLNANMRPMLIKMLEWKVGFQYDFSISCGKAAKYLLQYLPPEERTRLLKTYPAAEKEAIWESMEVMGSFFEGTAWHVSAKLNVEYCDREGRNAISFWRHIRSMPKDAKVIF